MIIDANTDVEALNARAQDYINSRNFTNDFPRIDAEDPWSKNSLDAIERYIVDSYAEYSEVPDEVEINLVYFIGTGLIKLTSGKWLVVDPEIFGLQSNHHGLCVESPDGSMYVMNSIVSNAMRFRTGEYWSSLFATDEAH